MISDRDKLEFLLEILKESGKWSRTNDDPTGLELEVADKIKQLTERLLGPASPDSVNPAERRIKVRMPDGTWKRFYESQLDKVPCKASHTGFKWVLKEDKAKQIDEMWQAHEGGKIPNDS